MTSRPSNPLKSILHPYIFVLKEGGGIKHDFLDYTLMLLFAHSTETLRSPRDDDHIRLDKTPAIEKQKKIHLPKIKKKKPLERLK